MLALVWLSAVQGPHRKAGPLLVAVVLAVTVTRLCDRSAFELIALPKETFGDACFVDRGEGVGIVRILCNLASTTGNNLDKNHLSIFHVCVHSLLIVSTHCRISMFGFRCFVLCTQRSKFPVS